MLKTILSMFLHLPQAIAEDEKLFGFHSSLARPDEGNIPGFPSTPGNRCHVLIRTALANLAFEFMKPETFPETCSSKLLHSGPS